MFSLILGLLGGAASQPAIVRPVPPPFIRTPVPAAPPRPAEIAIPATRARANLPSFFTTQDYPQDALRNDEKGTVAFTADVSPDGRVTHCAVTASSGSISLDSATCAIVQRRARFTPARDANGRAVEDRVTARIRWDLPPKPPLPFADVTMAMVFTVVDGAVTQCRMEGSPKPSSDAPCAPMMLLATKLAAEGYKRGALTTGELVLEQGIRIGGPDAALAVGRGEGETRINLAAMAVDIDADGSIARCVPAEGNGDDWSMKEGCKGGGKAKFVPLDPVASDRSDRHAVRYLATYIRSGS
jgi:TonB family protein